MNLLNLLSLAPPPRQSAPPAWSGAQRPGQWNYSNSVRVVSVSQSSLKPMTPAIRDHKVAVHAQAVVPNWEALATSLPTLKSQDSKGALPIFDGTSFSQAKDLALGRDRMIATQPEKALKAIEGHLSRIQSIQSSSQSSSGGSSSRAPDIQQPLQELQALGRLLSVQKSYAEGLVEANPFHIKQWAQAASLPFRAAAQLFPAESEEEKFFNAKADFYAAFAKEKSSGGQDRKGSVPDGHRSSVSHLLSPEKFASRGSRDKAVLKQQLGPSLQLAENDFISGASSGEDPREILEKAFELDLRSLAQFQAGRASGRKKHLKERFCIALDRVMQARPNPVVERSLAMPVHSDDKQAQSVMQVTCRQEPARVLTRAFAERYDLDGIQGVNCHDNMQHQHAVNLYRSSFEDSEESSLLSMIRHGVHSATGLTAQGIKAMDDQHLGTIALDFAQELADPKLMAIASKFQSQSQSQSQTTTAASSDSQGQSSLESAQREAAAHVRGGTGTFDSLKRFGAPSLIDRIRMVANRRRALESVQAAITCLPLGEIRRMTDSKSGEVPKLRLASVSLLTPEAVRGKWKGPSKDESLMWEEQQATWEALEAQKEVELEFPVVNEAQGDAHARGAVGGTVETCRVKVKLEIATFNVPVNTGGAHAIMGDLSMVVGDSHFANEVALVKLIGKMPINRASLENWNPGGWVGEAVDRLQGSADADRKKDLLALARQIADICLDPNESRKRQADPYRLVKRLLVLVHQTGLAAPMVNCRSGKDRTSEAETQARQFALEMRAGEPGKLPSIDVPPGVRDETQRLQLWNLHAGGGSREIQAWNTGFAGTKLKQAALEKQYGTDGDKGMRQQYQGGSKHVGH